MVIWDYQITGIYLGRWWIYKHENQETGEAYDDGNKYHK